MKDRPVAETSTYTTRNIHKRQTSMLLAVFEPAVPTSERRHTYAQDRAANGNDSNVYWKQILKLKILKCFASTCTLFRHVNTYLTLYIYHAVKFSSQYLFQQMPNSKKTIVCKYITILLHVSAYHSHYQWRGYRKGK